MLFMFQKNNNNNNNNNNKIVRKGRTENEVITELFLVSVLIESSFSVKMNVV